MQINYFIYNVWLEELLVIRLMFQIDQLTNFSHNSQKKKHKCNLMVKEWKTLKQTGCINSLY